MGMRWGIATILLLILGLQSGCASWIYKNEHTAAQCCSVDWESLYHENFPRKGEKNFDHTRIPFYESACPYNGISPDAAAKERALDRLQKDFCQPKAAAYNWGREAHKDPGICKPETGFTEAWKAGYKDFLIVELDYLHGDGVYKQTLDRKMHGQTPLNTNLGDFLQDSIRAQTETITELKIHPYAAKDESAREQALQEYTDEMDAILR